MRLIAGFFVRFVWMELEATNLIRIECRVAQKW